MSCRERERERREREREKGFLDPLSNSHFAKTYSSSPPISFFSLSFLSLSLSGGENDTEKKNEIELGSSAMSITQSG